MALTLYSFAGDFRAFKALIAAQYNGVDIATPEFDLATDGKKEEFLAKSPLGKVPLLDTPKGAIHESNAIARFIARIRADTHLMGYSFFEQGKVDAWLDFVSHELELPATMWVYPVLGYTAFDKKLHGKAVADTHKALAVLNKHLTANTFLVGHHVTLADIVAVAALLYPMKLVLTAEHLAAYPAVQRWFTTCVNQAAFKAVLGDVLLASEEILAQGNKAATAVPSAGAAAAGGKAGGKKGGKKGGAKKEQPKKEKKAAAPAPAAAKPPKPFEGLPKGSMDMESFKRHYSNAPYDANGDRDYYATMAPFFTGEGEISDSAKFDPSAYSIWQCDYQFNEENTMDFTTANLVGGFIQRSDAIRRGAFGTMLILGDKAPYEITGCWMFQGDSNKEVLDNNPDAEYYNWTKLDTSDPAVQKKVADYWCAVDKFEGKTVYDSKLFK